MTALHPLESDILDPRQFTYPFCYEPHPLCKMAAKAVQDYLLSAAELREDADRGKMFGVLVCRDNGGRRGFLAAYSGLLAGRNDWDYFVPPVFDAQQPDGHFKQTEREISQINQEIASLVESAECSVESSEVSALKLRRKQQSEELQLWLFHQYQMLNARGERKDLVALWQEYYREKVLRKHPLPPGGTGDCCAPKLLQYAYEHRLQPVCMAEFWYGQSPKSEIRHHLNFYPACRGKCKPILTWMLQGLDVEVNPETLGFPHLPIETIYEDDHLLVVDKPSGLLSTPGRVEQYSVETVMQQRYPGSFIAHRLDMWTSGLLIVAKSIEVYRSLQQQFVHHEVRKKYLAIVESGECGVQSAECRVQSAECRVKSLERAGTISLPLRSDMVNRPRQMVDMEHGKRAVTDYEFLSDDVVALYPHTGRTHQLRIHCAHPSGLGRPIVGDELYGTTGGRLQLYATEIWFRHPVSGAAMHLELPLPHDILARLNDK